ncbi:hypothetical protein T636_A1537 [Enterobacter hormaechei subsp. xiangfangensis]|nr:hypothetical protein T636_A1537 [Enterobacter hormaechei subsp. xiangfangensis]
MTRFKITVTPSPGLLQAGIELGVNAACQPLYRQFLRYIGNVLQGDFGISMGRAPGGGDCQPLYAYLLVNDCQYELGGVFGLGAGTGRLFPGLRWACY